MKSFKKQTRGGNRIELIRELGRIFGLTLPLIVFLLVSLFPVCSTAAETITIGGGTGTAVTEPQLVPAADTSVLPADTAVPSGDILTPTVDTSTPTLDTSGTPTPSDSPSPLPSAKTTTKTASLASASATTATDSPGSGGGVAGGPSADNSIFTGAATSSFPIEVPAGRLGIAPALALTYNSYQQNGWVGVGWSLDLGSIQRSTKRGVNYSANDFVFSTNGSTSELVPRSDWGTNYYGAKIEGAFTKFYRNTTADQWVVTGKDGVTYYYGKTPYDTTIDARQNNTLGVFKWCLVWVQDSNGNFMKINYVKDQGEVYPSQIEYTGNGILGPSNMVKFTREARTDAPSLYTTNALVKTAYRLKTIDVQAKDINGVYQLARRYGLTYDDTTSSSHRSVLTAITAYDSNGAQPLTTSLTSYAAAQNFTTPPNSGLTGYYGTNAGWSNDNTTPRYMADVNGDGKADIVGFASDGVYVALSAGVSFAAPTRWVAYYGTESGGWSNNYVSPRYMADVNGDGKADIVGFAKYGVYVALSTGTSFTAQSLWVSGYGTNSGWTNTDAYPRYLTDVNGDGKADIVGFANAGVYVSLSTGSSFTTGTSWITGYG